MEVAINTEDTEMLDLSHLEHKQQQWTLALFSSHLIMTLTQGPTHKHLTSHPIIDNYYKSIFIHKNLWSST